MILVLLLLLVGHPSHAQQDSGSQLAPIDEQVRLEIGNKLQQFVDEMTIILTDASTGDSDSIDAYEQHYKLLDAKWTTYYQAQQMDIAADDALMDLAADYQTTSQMARERIDEMKADVQDNQDFIKAETFIKAQEKPYARYYKEAVTLSMVAKLAPRLEKLKAQEQLLFADVQEHYTKAKAVADNNPSLKKRMKALEDKYLAIKGYSDKIQQAVYQPLIQRIKDKLLITAALAIILMFVSMVGARLKAFKNARDMARKFKSQFQNNQDYPTI